MDLGFGVCGSGLSLNVRRLNVAKEPPSVPLPAVPIKGRPAVTRSFAVRPPPSNVLSISGTDAAHAPACTLIPKQYRPAKLNPPPMAVVRLSSSSIASTAPQRADLAACRAHLLQGSAPRGACDELDPSTSWPGAIGAAEPPSALGDEPMSSLGIEHDASNAEAQRMRAVRRLREQRERREREEEEDRQRVADAKQHAMDKEREGRDAKEKREQKRAEVLAINKLMTARDAEAFGAFAASRQDERDEVDRRHAAEDEERRAHASATQAKADARVRQHEADARKERQKEKHDAEAEKRRKAEVRNEVCKREDDRELWRAQVYAINKLMAARDAEAFADFKRTHGLEDEENAESAALTDDAAAAADRAFKRRGGKHAARAALSQSLPLRAGAGANAAGVSASSDSFGTGGKFGALLSRSWGNSAAAAGVSDAVAGRSASVGGGGSSEGGADGELSSRSLVLGAAGAGSGGGGPLDENEAAIVSRLARATESASMLDMGEELRKRGKGGTYRQQVRPTVGAPVACLMD